MSTLKVNKIRDTSGSADAITLDPSGGAVLAGVTTISTARVTSGIVTNTFIVGAGVTISESGIEASGIGITCASINGTQIGGRRNLVINGAMNVAQRGTSSTTSGYGSVDRFEVQYSGTDEAPTHSQADVASGTTPYTEGFRKSLKITNGNQTGGAGAGDLIRINHILEAQNVANSGWNYTSSSSFITVSFWVKSSVAQNFYGYLYTYDGSNYSYPFETGTLTADTWTKITKTISGNSNITIDNNNAQGLVIVIAPFFGTNYTASGVTLNAWKAWSGSERFPDNTSTWYTTNDATFEITGVQLEVGSQATPFEHRSLGEELSLCQRYYQVIAKGSDGTSGARAPLVSGAMWGAGEFYGVFTFKTKMRTIPSLDVTNGTDYWQVYNQTTDTCDTLAYNNASPEAISLYLSGNLNGTAQVGAWSRTNNAAAFAAAKAEL